MFGLGSQGMFRPGKERHVMFGCFGWLSCVRVVPGTAGRGCLVPLRSPVASVGKFLLVMSRQSWKGWLSPGALSEVMSWQPGSGWARSGPQCCGVAVLSC